MADLIEMKQAAAHHFGIAWDELSPFEQAHWEAAWVASRAAVVVALPSARAASSREIVKAVGRYIFQQGFKVEVKP